MELNLKSCVLWWILAWGMTSPAQGQQPADTWLASWRQQNPQWRALHLASPDPAKLPLTRQLISEVLVPMDFNVLILGIGYGFQYRSHPELQCRGLDHDQARELTEFCRNNGIRLIPLFDCLGHQSWAKNTNALLARYPEFDETPQVPPDNQGIYCREWCPSHPGVNRVVFDLLDELADAFDADALHVGMDEVFLIGDDQCPRCRGKDPAELFAKVVNELHVHLVREKGLDLLMWGDRLLDANRFDYGKWEASDTGSHRALDLIPRDIIVCDWHYELRENYPSVTFFQEQGFRVLPSPWRKPDAAVALIRHAYRNRTDRMLGVLFTGWGGGGNGEHILSALQAAPETTGEASADKGRSSGASIAVTIEAGVRELNAQLRP